MIITVLRDKYNCGSNRGITYIDQPNLVGKLNQIINWNLSTFPFKIKEKPEDPDVEDREFLGKEPELKPGNMFVYDGQVIACDSKDRLILVLSETGALALKRIYENIISLEFDLKFNYENPHVTFEKDDKANIPADYEEYTVPYYLMMTFKNNFLLGRDFPRKGLCLKAVLDSDNYVLPTTIYITDWTLKYNPLIIDKEQIPDTAKELFSWFYNKFDPIIIEPEPESAPTPEDGADVGS